MGPFTIVKSIDSLTETLADMLSAEGRGFTLSTKNIGNKNTFKENIDYLSELSSKYRRHSFDGENCRKIKKNRISQQNKTVLDTVHLKKKRPAFL